MDAIFGLLFVLAWCFVALNIVLPVVLSIDRRFAWNRWCHQPGFQFWGGKVPPQFPIDLLGDFVFFVKIRNCVCNQRNGRQRIVFDLDISPFWSRGRQWVTLVAVEGQFTEAHPWTNPSAAMASQGKGWILFRPCDALLARNLWLLADLLPSADRLLEIEAVRSLWREAEPTLVAAEQEYPRQSRVSC